MRKKTLTVRKNRDGTITIRSDRYVEHVDTRGKLPWEKYEIVKWAIVTARIPFTAEIEEIVRDELGV
jgi:hypothetical protein